MALGRSEEIRQRVELVLHGIGIWTPGDCGSTDACGRVILRGAPAGFKYSATGHPGLRHGRHRARHPADPHLGITLHPTGESTAQQARNLITDPGDQAGHVKFMIRDRGPDFTAAFDPVLADAGIRTVLCNVRTPRMNAIAERWTRGTRFSARTGPGAARADHLHDHVSATSATDRTASLRSAALPRLGQPAARGRTPRSPASMM